MNPDPSTVSSVRNGTDDAEKFVSPDEHSLLLPRRPSAARNTDEAIPFSRSSLIQSGWKSFFDTLAALLAALPMGRLADKMSHSQLFALILTGFLANHAWTIAFASQQHLPVQWIWASSIFTLVGGGSYAAEMMLSVMLSITAIIPEIHEMSVEAQSPDVKATADTIWPMNSQRDAQQRNWCRFHEEVYIRLTLFQQCNMLLAAPIFFITTFRGISVHMLLQYASVRFGWKLSQVGDLAYS
ncbi:hypothetical protein CLAIMM_04796 [Cladophialophora immunda]|nr:hypothetical protein CLAIMM_04796 [Cladophialophora immunda]